MFIRAVAKREMNTLIPKLIGKTIIISITDPKEAEYHNMFRKPILKLKFHDMHYLPVEDRFILFNKEMAQQIVKFIKKYQDADHLVVHCSAGLSRSPAVAAAISEYLHIPHTFFETHLPNTMVFSILRTTFGF